MENKGFIVKCDAYGKIMEVKRNDLIHFEEGEPLTKFIDPSSVVKLLSFLDDLNNKQSAIGWEVNLKIDDSFYSIYLAGVKEQNSLIVIGTTDVLETRKYYNNLMVMNNYQQNQLRDALKNNAKVQESLKRSESFDQMTKINNEMTSLQRELSKKNNVLEVLNKALNEKNRELDGYANMVTHDLKAPLNNIRSLLEIINNDHATEFNQEVIKLFGMVMDCALKMNTLINDILAYSKAGTTEKKIGTFQLSDLFKEVLSLIGAPEEYTFSIPDKLPEITGSYTQLHQVFTNLMSNAVKYHHATSGNIEIFIEDQDLDNFKFSVKDDGPGIPEKYHEKVFNVFQTAHGQNRDDSTGIGLAIVKKLVEQTGGEIGLISKVGLGSTFWFTWPKDISLNRNELN